MHTTAVTWVDIVNIAIPVIIAIFTIPPLRRGLKNWRIDKTKEFYKDLRERKAKVLEVLGSVADDTKKNYEMIEFLSDLEVIAIMYYKNSIEKSLFKEMFFPLFKDVYENQYFKKTINELKCDNATAYENFEKICKKHIT